MKKIFIIIISLLLINSAFAVQVKTPLSKLSKSFKGSELIKIPSYNAPPFPHSFTGLKDESYKKSPVVVDALISYPKKGEAPFPLVVFSHASGGPNLFISKGFAFDKQMAKQLLKKGIAVMFLDNYSGRGVKDTHKDQSQVSVYSGYINASMALEYLSKNSKVNIKKVGITGWSRGGMNSTIISEKRIRDILINKDLYYAAALPMAVDCAGGGFFKNPQVIKETKTWMVNGEIDDVTLAAPCIPYAKKLKAGGADIKVTTKKGWGHGFTGNFPAEFEPQAQVFTDCPDWYIQDNGTSIPESNYSWDDPCIGKGNTIGGNKGSVLKKPFLKFFTENLLN